MNVEITDKGRIGIRWCNKLLKEERFIEDQSLSCFKAYLCNIKLPLLLLLLLVLYTLLNPILLLRIRHCIRLIIEVVWKVHFTLISQALCQLGVNECHLEESRMPVG